MGRLRAECDIAISKGEEKGDIWVTALGLAHVSCFLFAFCNLFFFDLGHFWGYKSLFSSAKSNPSKRASVKGLFVYYYFRHIRALGNQVIFPQGNNLQSKSKLFDL